MRRKEKEITDPALIDDILHRAQVLRLAMARDNQPYIVPLCFGYEARCIYAHAAREGMKLDFLRENAAVCFECEVDVELIAAEKSCNWGIKYQSVIGFGRAEIVDDRQEKHHACDIIMRHYAKQFSGYDDSAIDKIVIIKIKIDSLTGKQSG